MSILLHLEHVQLDMSPDGEDRARQFYVDLLGLREIPMAAKSRAGGGIWFAAENVSFEIHMRTMRTLQPAESAHTAIRVTGVAELAERCAAAGFAPEHDSRYPGRTRFYVRDPFGNRLEFFEIVG